MVRSSALGFCFCLLGVLAAAPGLCMEAANKPSALPDIVLPPSALAAPPALLAMDEGKARLALSSLKATIDQNLLGARSLQAVNRLSLQALSAGVDEALKVAADPRALEGSVWEASELLATAMQSQDWLSPTQGFSEPWTQRGILQDTTYGGRYERENLNPRLIERQLSSAFARDHAVLFRNKNVLFGDVSVSLAASTRGVLYLSASFRRAAGQAAGHFSRAGLELEKPAPGDWPAVLAGSRANALFVDEAEVGDAAALLDEVSKHNKERSEGERIENIFISATRPLTLPPQDPEGAAVHLLVEISRLVPPGVRLSLAGADTAAALLGNGKDKWTDPPLFKRLKEGRAHQGGHLDGISKWHLRFLLSWAVSPTGSAEKLDEETERGFHDKYGAGPRADVAELRLRYERLGAVIKNAPGPTPLSASVHDVAKKRIARFLALLRRMPKSPRGLAQAQFSQARSEYRALSRYAAFFRGLALSAKSGMEAARAKLEASVERRLNSLTGLALSTHVQSSLATTSGMAAVELLLRLAVEESARRPLPPLQLLMGSSLYYEIPKLLDNLHPAPFTAVRISERDTPGILKAVASGSYGALFLDPIANSVRDEPDPGTIARQDFPVADLRAILEQLVQRRFDRPFLLALDTSLFGAGFEAGRLLKGLSLPPNFHLITYTSLQKLHQDGLEFTTGGAVTILSRDHDAHERLIESLRGLRGMLGSRPSLLSYLHLDDALRSPWSAARTERIMANAEELARFIESEMARLRLPGQVFHPALASSPDHAIWLKNGRPGLPFVALRMPGVPNFTDYAAALGDELAAAGLPLHLRDSYGFNDLSYTVYNGKNRTLRLSLAPFGKEEMAKIKWAVSNTLEAIAARTQGK